MSKNDNRSSDDRCYDLAEHFLFDGVLPPDKEGREQCKRLAATIQQAVEDWFKSEETP